MARPKAPLLRQLIPSQEVTPLQGLTPLQGVIPRHRVRRHQVDTLRRDPHRKESLRRDPHRRDMDSQVMWWAS